MGQRGEEGREEEEDGQRAAQVRSPSAWGSKGFKVVAVVVDCFSVEGHALGLACFSAVGVGDPLPFLPP